jgi:DNA polymerase III subunit delta
MPKKTSFSELHAAIQKGKLEPVYFFYGKEDFLVDELIAALKSKLFQTPHEAKTNTTVMYGGTGADKTISFGDVISAASEYGMFAEKKLVIVRDFDKIRKPSKEQQKPVYATLARYVESPLETTTLVLCGGELDKKDLTKEPYTLLDTVSYEMFAMRDLSGFASDYVARLGWRITPPALNMLVMYAGNSARDLGNELQKLVLYAEGRADKTLTDKDVADAVGVSKDYNVFELQKSIASKDMRMASGIALKILEKENLIVVVNALTVFFTRLWKLHSPVLQRMSESDAAKELGMFGGQSYFLKDYKQYASMFYPAQLENALLALHRADLTLKGIAVDGERRQADEQWLALELVRDILT